MTRFDRCKRLLIAVALLLPLSSCQHLGLAPGGEEVLEVRVPLRYLECPQPGITARPDTQVIGRAGGRLQSGNNELTIPANALSDNVRFIFRPVPGDSVGIVVDQAVRFENDVSATLVVDVSRCADVEQADWWVWRINRRGGPSQKLRTRTGSTRFVTRIDSTSVFMIAN